MAYHVLIDGEQRGPLEVAEIAAMARRSEITGDTLVWSPDMTDWSPAATVSELAAMFRDSDSSATGIENRPLRGRSKLAVFRSLGDGLRVIGQQPIRLIGVIILYAILSIVAMAPVFLLFAVGVVASSAAGEFGASVSTIVLSLFAYVATYGISAALYGGLCATMLDAVRGTQIRFGRLLSGFPRIVTLFLFSLMAALIIAVPVALMMLLYAQSLNPWVLLLCLPIIFLMVTLILGPFLVMDKSAGPVQALAGSCRSVLQLGWLRVFVALLLLVVIFFFVMLAVGLVTSLLGLATVGIGTGVGGDEETLSILHAIISGLPQILISLGLTAVMVSVIAAIYEQAQAR